jgi:hypothetical protein
MNSSNTGSGSPYNPFSTGSTSSSGLKEFVDSNSLVAKIAFLLLVLFGFVIALRLGISILAYFLSPSGSPHLIDGMVDGKQMIIYPQDPNTSGAKTITRSVNANDGIEFTWSTWVFIDNLQYNAGKYKHVFHKGNDQVASTGLNFPNNAPGLYIAPNTNAFVIIMNTYDNINEEITIPDIPLNKWVSVIMRCQNKTLDVYINGTIVRSVQLAGVPKQNYGDVFVAMNGGFSGYVSNLWYYNYGLGTAAIQNIVQNGPNTKMVGSNAMNMKNPNYLSLRWYFYGTQDQFNP